MLLRYGADPDKTDSSGSKALHNVAVYWSPELDRSKDVIDTLRGPDYSTRICDDGRPLPAFLLVPRTSNRRRVSALARYNIDEAHGNDHTVFSLQAMSLSQYGLGRQEWGLFVRKLLQKYITVHVRAPQRTDKVGLAVTTPLDELFPFTAARSWEICLQKSS